MYKINCYFYLSFEIIRNIEREKKKEEGLWRVGGTARCIGDDLETNYENIINKYIKLNVLYCSFERRRKIKRKNTH